MYTKETFDNQCFISLNNGTCGMNQKAIAKLSGIANFNLTRLIQNSIATKSDNSFLQDLYCASESTYLVDLQAFNHKIWKSEYAYNLICYAATELKNDAAIETLTRLGQIGLRTFIQDLTGFQVHKGSDDDLKALHDILGIKEEMIRRIDHKVANMEYFQKNISNIWQVLFEFRRGTSYYRDLAVLPPQVQKNAFRAINVLKELFMSIQRLRNDFEVISLDQLSKERISMVSKTLPAALRSTKVLPGEGVPLKQWQWDDLFSLDFHTLYDETKVSEDKDGVSTFGRRKDLTKLSIQIAQEDRAAQEEEILSTIVKKSLKSFKKEPQMVSELFITARANYVGEERVLARVAQSIPEILEDFTIAYKGCEESRARLNTINYYLRQLDEDLADTTEDELDLILQTVNLIDSEMETVFGEDRYHEFPQPYHDDSARHYVFANALKLTQFRRYHFYYPELFDCCYRWEHEILPNLEKSLGLPWKNTDKMSSLNSYAHKNYLIGESRFDTVLDKYYTFESYRGSTEADYVKPIMTLA
jgi:hypothetical protein